MDGLLHVATCNTCGREQKAKPTKDGTGVKTPMGWRKVGDQLLCNARGRGESRIPGCIEKAYYTRGFRVEIRGLADGEERDAAEFRAALSAASKATARFGNWYIQRLYAADLAAEPTLEMTKDGKTKLPPCPEFDFYRAATIAFPELAPASIVALGKMVRGWYSSDRFQTHVALNRSVRNFRWGELPVEIPKQAWSLKSGADGKFTIQTQVGPGKSWPVKVYADSLGVGRLRAIANGEAVPLALKLVRASKAPVAGSTERRKAWFFRISAMFPRKTKRQSHQEITLTLGHDAGVLLFGALEGSQDVFEFPGQAARTLIVGGDVSDRKRQQESSVARGLWPKRKQLRWNKDRARVCENRSRKITQQVKLAAAALARWCVSHGVTSVDYDLTDRGFVPHFPWRALRDAIHSALERDGVDEISMRSAIELSDWFGHEARRVYGLFHEDDDDRETRELLTWIQRHGRSVTVRDLTRGPRYLRNAPEAAEAALGALVAAGYGHWEQVPTTSQGGKPTRRFILASSGDGDITSKNLVSEEVSSPSPVSPVFSNKVSSGGDCHFNGEVGNRSDDGWGEI